MQIKRMQIEKEEIKIPLFVGVMTPYIRGPKDSTKQLFNLINIFSKATDLKSAYKKLAAE